MAFFNSVAPIFSLSLPKCLVDAGARIMGDISSHDSFIFKGVIRHKLIRKVLGKSVSHENLHLLEVNAHLRPVGNYYIDE